MSLSSWVDARLAVFAPVLAKAMIADDGPLVAQINTLIATNEAHLATQMTQALNTAVAQALANPATQAMITTAVKNALPTHIGPFPI
jgi:hypothetical protein